MHILLVGLNHKVAPVEVREKLSFGESQLGPALEVLPSHVREGVVLSTCNRTEVYALTGHGASGTRSVKHFLSEQRAVPVADFESYLYSYHQQEAVRHLFRVAAGLDSMILGEPQVLGQVREAYEAAEARGAIGPVLSALFRQAITTGKRVHTETEISRSAASVSYAAVELARKIFGALGPRTVLVVGAGEMAKLALKTLVDNGVGRVLVANRTRQRAEELAALYRGECTDFERLEEALARSDIVISSTAATGYVITPPTMRAAMRARSHRPMFLIDIAVPRDIDPAVQREENVFLYNVDDLEAVCQANLEERAKEAKKAEAIIEEEVAKFQAWWQSLEAVPTVTALRDWAESIRQAELAKALGKLHDLSERDRNTVAALTTAIVNKILHPATVELKRNGGSYARSVRELFRLDEVPK